MDRKIDLKGLCILLVDMQDKFVEKNYRKMRIVPNQVRILEFCNANLVPIVVFEYVGYGKTVEDIRSVVEI